MRREIAVVAGEASGDRIASGVVTALARRGVRCFGVAGLASRRAGLRPVTSAEMAGAMGLFDLVPALPRLVRGVTKLAREVLRDPPAAALLVNFTELNAVLGRRLRALGTRVLWCVAPQVWAWREGRLASLRGAFDRLAVILPFEEELWRSAGYDARFVGHPSWPRVLPAATRARSLAILPGSRDGEARRLAMRLLEAGLRLLDDGTVHRAEVLVAPSLSGRVSEAIAERARRLGIETVPVDATEGASPLLARHALALSASGTACLEAALAGAAPVVAYRMDPFAFALAKRLVRTRYVALPNVLLGRRAFPELLQADAEPRKIAAAARALFAHRDAALAAREELHARLAPPADAQGRGDVPFDEAVTAMLLPWLDATTLG